jgi:hypothetical protein
VRPTRGPKPGVSPSVVGVDFDIVLLGDSKQIGKYPFRS